MAANLGYDPSVRSDDFDAPFSFSYARCKYYRRDPRTAYAIHVSFIGGVNLAKVGYRVRQFWCALTAAPDPSGLSEIGEILAPQLMALFLQMQPSEQAHSLEVFRKLSAAGETNRDVQIAALLHDVGKIKFPLNIWERAEIVMLKRIAPEKVTAWGNAQPDGWRKPFVVALQHPQWGADMAEQAGASALAVSLIRRHQDRLPGVNAAPIPFEDQLLKQLQFYDNES